MKYEERMTGEDALTYPQDLWPNKSKEGWKENNARNKKKK